jgi:hypothetical protein
MALSLEGLLPGSHLSNIHPERDKQRNPARARSYLIAHHPAIRLEPYRSDGIETEGLEILI